MLYRYQWNILLYVLPQVGDTAAALRLGEVSAWGRPDKA